MNYLSLSLIEIHQALVNKEVTPLELTKQALALIRTDKNNAFEYVLEKEALHLAEQLSNEEPEDDNIFWGVPFTIKDNFSTKGIPTCASSKLLEGYVPVFSSEVYQKLLNAKAILIAKTTLDELAMGGTGSSGHKGKTFNPWDKSQTRMMGGSSCGSAASCASGIVPFSIGSDTGDSVRKPASYGGLVGFKPTWGLISRFGLFPFAPSLDTVAYFTRNVIDSAHLLNLLAGHDKKDMTSAKEKKIDYVKNIDKKLPFILGIIEEIYSEISDTGIRNAFENSLQELKKKGLIIKRFSLDIRIAKAIYPTYYIISSAEATSSNANLDGIKFGMHLTGDSYEEMLYKVRTTGFSNRIKRRFVIGGLSLLEENQQEIYLRALRSRRVIVNALNDILKQCDAIYLPASPTIAKPFGEDVPTKSFDRDANIADNYLAMGNLGGYPSLTLPLGFKNGMPFGVNLTGAIFKDATVLQIAKIVEDVTGLKNLLPEK